jgi:AcrR family transcriptional regulator
MRARPRIVDTGRRSSSAAGGRRLESKTDNLSAGARGSGAASRSAPDEKIISAVLSIIREQGLDAVTIEGVTARSGVAKTTIYRRYSDRFELLADVLNQLAPPPGRRSFAISKEGLVAVVREEQRVLDELFGLAAVGRILASDAALSRRWNDKVIAPRIDAVRDFLAQGVREGLLAPDVDYDRIVEMIIGGMVIGEALRGELPRGWADKVVGTLWPLIRRRGGTTPRSEDRP